MASKVNPSISSTMISITSITAIIGRAMSIFKRGCPELMFTQRERLAPCPVRRNVWVTRIVRVLVSSGLRGTRLITPPKRCLSARPFLTLYYRNKDTRASQNCQQLNLCISERVASERSRCRLVKTECAILNCLPKYDKIICGDKNY